MYYLFSPLLDQGGKQVVRVPNKYEWYIDPYGEPTEMWLDMKEEAKKGTIGADDKYPILTLQKFETIKELKKYVLFL